LRQRRAPVLPGDPPGPVPRVRQRWRGVVQPDLDRDGPGVLGRWSERRGPRGVPRAGIHRPAGRLRGSLCLRLALPRRWQLARRCLVAASASALLAAACVAAPPPDATNTPLPSQVVSTSTPAPTPTLVPQPADAPAVSFARADLAHGSSSGVTGTGPLTLAASGLATGTYDDPHGQSGIAYHSGSWP